ncbi:hypothetical protein N2152v2_007976 [Parachlorella kessleri]
MAEAPSGGNEPHHVGLSADGQSAIPDEFVTLPDGGFLVTMMGSATGGSPGRVAKLNPDFSLQGEYPTSPPTVPPLNPHGIAVDFKRRRMVTGDYLLPASTLIPTNGPVLRSTFRVWDLDSMEIISTYDVGPVDGAGFMDARMLGDTGVAILGSGEGIVYGVNVSNPSDVKEIYLPAGSGPHYIRLSSDERLAVVSTFFLDEDPAKGIVHLAGSRMVYFFDIVAL